MFLLPFFFIDRIPQVEVRLTCCVRSRCSRCEMSVRWICLPHMLLLPSAAAVGSHVGFLPWRQSTAHQTQVRSQRLTPPLKML